MAAVRLVLRVVAVLVILGGLVLLGTELAAKPFAERAIARQVRDDHDLATTPDVSLDGFPFAVQVARGRLDGATVTIDDYVAEGLTLRRAVLRLRDITFDAADLVDGGGDVRAGSGTLTATVADTDVTAFLATRGIPLTAHFTPGSVAVDGQIDVLGTTFAAAATGTVAIADGALRFDPGTVTLNGAETPAELLDAARTLTAFTVPLPQVAGVQVTTASIGQGAATLTADITDYLLTARATPAATS